MNVRVVLADPSEDYLHPLVVKFLEVFADRISLELVTEETYFQELFSTPQQVSLLLVTEEWELPNPDRHTISHHFVLTEEKGRNLGEGREGVYKYSSVREIFEELTVKSADVLQLQGEQRKEPQIILVTSASGGVGKSSISLGLCRYLAGSLQRVLYVDAELLALFPYYLANQDAINDSDLYRDLHKEEGNRYDALKHWIRQEEFFYLPPFKAALPSLGLSEEIFLDFIRSARESYEYDYIIVDSDSNFNDFKMKLFNLSQRILFVLRQDPGSVYAIEQFFKNVNWKQNDTLLFVVNHFQEEKKNAFLAKNFGQGIVPTEYIEEISDERPIPLENLVSTEGMQKLALALM